MRAFIRILVLLGAVRLLAMCSGGEGNDASHASKSNQNARAGSEAGSTPAPTVADSTSASTVASLGGTAVASEDQKREPTVAAEPATMLERLEVSKEKLASFDVTIKKSLQRVLVNDNKIHDELTELTGDVANLRAELETTTPEAAFDSELAGLKLNAENNTQLQADSRKRLQEHYAGMATMIGELKGMRKELATRLGVLEKECDSWIAGYNELAKISTEEARKDVREHILKLLDERADRVSAPNPAVSSAKAVKQAPAKPMVSSAVWNSDNFNYIKSMLGILPESSTEGRRKGIVNGVEVVFVYPDSAAYDAYLSTGDVVVKIDDEIVNNKLELSRILAKHNGGDLIKLAYLHRGKQGLENVRLRKAHR